MRKLLTLCSAIAVVLLSSCNVNIKWKNNIGTPDFTQKNSETQTIDLNGIKKIEIDINAGDCSVIFDDTAQSTINVDYEFKATNKKKAENLMNSTEMRCETNGDTLCINFINSETGNEIENKNSVIIITDMKIVLPESNMSFDMSADIGDIDISGFSGAFSISSDVGNITAKDLTVTGNSDFSADVGNIDCELAEISANELDFTADVGDIGLSVGKTEKSKISIESDIGNITLNTQGKSCKQTFSKKDDNTQERKIIIDNKCTVEMKAELGDIKISK